ncbi:MAG: 3-deoxy-manno-octulosonate cytidylyltransferase [Nonlabens sp.]
MKIIAIIPARLQASRFPNKLLQDLCGKSVIVRTYQATVETQLFEEVLVATDSKEIQEEIESIGGRTYFSTTPHDCGSNRIAEAAQEIDADIVINVQGDEPFTNEDDLQALIEVFKKDDKKEISMASLKHKLQDPVAIQDPNNVKVITDLKDNAIYFSRSPIPFERDNSIKCPVFKHIGIYAFRKDALIDFYKSEATPLELTEKIECIRYLERGKKIKMVATSRHSIGIDTPSDLAKARELWTKTYS